MHQYAEVLAAASARYSDKAGHTPAEEVRTMREAFFASVAKDSCCLGLSRGKDEDVNQEGLPPFVALCNLGGRQLLYQSESAALVRVLPLAAAASKQAVAAAIGGLIGSSTMVSANGTYRATVALFFSLPFHCPLESCFWEMRMLYHNASSGRIEDSGLGLRIHDCRVKKMSPSQTLAGITDEAGARLCKALARQVSAACLDPPQLPSEGGQGGGTGACEEKMSVRCADAKLLALLHTLQKERSVLLESHKRSVATIAETHAKELAALQDAKRQEKTKADKRVAAVVEAAKSSNELAAKKLQSCETQKSALLEQKLELVDELKRLNSDMAAATLTREQDLKTLKALKAKQIKEDRSAASASARDKALALLEQSRAELRKRDMELKEVQLRQKQGEKEKQALMDNVCRLRQDVAAVEAAKDLLLQDQVDNAVELRGLLESMQTQAAAPSEATRSKVAELEKELRLSEARRKVWKACFHLGALRFHKVWRKAEASSHMQEQLQKRNHILEERCTSFERVKQESMQSMVHPPLPSSAYSVSSSFSPYPQHFHYNQMQCGNGNGNGIAAPAAGGPVDASLEATIANAHAAFAAVVQSARSASFYKHQLGRRSFYDRGPSPGPA